MDMEQFPNTVSAESGEEFLKAWDANVAALDGLYDPADERDSCGVGLVAALDGKRRREVVEAGIAALKAIWHRGAVDADGKTGDGAGIHVEIPQEFLQMPLPARVIGRMKAGLR